MSAYGIFPFSRVVPSTVRILYGFECAKCHKVQVQEVCGVEFYSPDWPEGWTPVGPPGMPGEWYCPRHTIEVKVTDKW